MKTTSTTLLLAASSLLAATSSLAGQEISSASRSTAGAVGDGHSGDTRMSGDGRYVVFSSLATNLDGIDSNGKYDIYLRDTELGTCERITTAAGGGEPDGDSRWPALSDNGRYIVFGSSATNLVSGDTNGAADVFFHDVALGTTERVNLTWLGLQSYGGGSWSDMVDVSDDGRYVVFCSLADDLQTLFTGGATRDVYLRDRIAGTTTLVSIKAFETQSSGGWAPSISADGSLVSFTSNDHLLHPLDTDANDDVFLWHRASGFVDLISVGTSGYSGSSPGNSGDARISPDGRYVVFESTCTDLDPADTTVDVDIYLADRTAGTVEVVSYDVDGATGPYTECEGAHLSADARFVVFIGRGMTHAPDPAFGRHVYLRDRTLGTTELITIPRWWFTGFLFGGGRPQVSDDGSRVVFEDSDAGTPEGGMSIYSQVLVRERDGSSNTVSMTCYNSAGPGYALTLTGYDAPAGSTAFAAWSMSASGSTAFGHDFDLGGTVHLLGSAVADADGKVVWTSAPIPASASGRTLYLELAVKSGVEWYDSNYAQFDVL